MANRKDIRRRFDREFKVQAVKMVLEEGLPVVEVAKRLNVNQTQVHNWKQEYLTTGDEAFPGKGQQRSEENEIKRLKKKLADAEEERDILKKAVAIFSKKPE